MPKSAAKASPAPRHRPSAAKAKVSTKRGKRPPAPKPLGPTGPAFYVDRQGHARRAGGDPIMPGEIAGVLVDKRGETGDLGRITWADGSMGIPKGMQIDITIADAD